MVLFKDVKKIETPRTSNPFCSATGENAFSWYRIVFLLSFMAFSTLVFVVKSHTLAIGLSALLWLSIILSPIDEAFALCFFSYPLSGVFDDCGFLYFFNISCLALLFKIVVHILIRNIKIRREIIFAVVLTSVLAIIDLVDAAHFNVLTSSYLSNFTVWTSLLLLILSACAFENINIKKIFYYALLGFVLSCVLCSINILNRWGSINNIPVAYRFVGMLRDPNYYSLFGIIMAFSSLALMKGWIKHLFFIPLLLLSLLSISKMAILLAAGGILLFVLSLPFAKKNYGNVNKHNAVGYIFIFVIVLLLLVAAFASGLFSWFINKVSFRLDNNALTTGRDILQAAYLDIFIKNPRVTILGSSLNYNYVYNVSYANYENMVSHNTFLDVLLSFGIIGTILFFLIFATIVLAFLNSIIKHNFKPSFQHYLVPIIFLVSLFSLSYLKADGFYLLILFIIGLFFSDREAAFKR